MFRSIKEYLARGGVMQEIIICANDPREYRAFQHAFGEASKKAPAA
jgi:hypothetical protein